MYVIGIDIGGTTIKIGVFQDKKMLDKWQIETKDNFIIDIKESIKAKYDLSKIKGYGIGLPGMVSNDKIGLCPNIKINQCFLEEFKVAMQNENVKLGNDANLATLAECQINGYQNAVMLTLGTGVGGGIYIGHVIEGFDGGAGEIGHMNVFSGYECNCGKKGCLETVGSATGLKRLALEEKIDCDCEKILKEATNGNKMAIKVVEKYCDYLGIAIANITSVLNPEYVIIGGGVSNGGIFLLENIKKAYQKYAYKPLIMTKIVLAKLKNDAGIIGASLLI